MDTMAFRDLADKVVKMLRDLAPRDSGNLADNAIRMEYPDENTVKIYVDEAIAPYMPYTNEPWVSAYWKGKKNPNEYWFDNAVAFIMNTIASQYGGEISRVQNSPEDMDLPTMTKEYQNKRGDLFEEDMWINSAYLENYNTWDVTRPGNRVLK